MKFDILADLFSLDKTVNALKEKGYTVKIVSSGKEALTKIKNIIPDGASVMNGSSVTLEEIGYIDYLKSGIHKWIDLHKSVNAENDPIKRNKLRREATLSDYYLGSVHALTESGEFVIASNTGSQLPHITFNSPNLIFVVSTKKIVKDMNYAMERIEKYCLPLEDKHLMELRNVHTELNKILIFKNESSLSNRKINFILVKENLGF